MASVDLEREDAIRMPSKMALYPSMEDIRAINGYTDIVKNYGKENVFFQGVNVKTFEFIGLFNADGNLLVDADGQLVQ
jgi:hypothetical protein